MVTDRSRVLACVALALLLAGCKKPLRDSNDPDSTVLNQLAAAGDDPSIPRMVRFYLYLPTEAAAKSAAAEISQVGLMPIVRRGAKGPDWLFFATKTLVPTLDALHEARTQLTDAAKRNGGEYDGWESPAEKRAR
jgi:hypothetical protein